MSFEYLQEIITTLIKSIKTEIHRYREWECKNTEKNYFTQYVILKISIVGLFKDLGL